ncbi:MAG TPA: glycoside hydrolase family 3 C-terminal domain-containing protein [Candidatus Kryptonia bacterium]
MNRFLPDSIVVVFAAAISLLTSGAGPRPQGSTVPVYKNPNLPVDQRVEDLLGRMTMDEKLSMLGGTGFATKPNERLGIPELKMSDGPLGVRWGRSTAFPAGMAMAASWDTSLINRVGKSIGEELRGKGRDVILGPCVNIARLPIGGRDFESYGEDPYLASRMAVSYIQGVQSEKVAATVKHFAANNQEFERGFVDEKIDKRTLNEIYLPAFKAAVEEGKVLAVMSAYNKINGHFCSENDYILKDKLKDEWKFDGLVMSDWGAVHSTIPTANGGLDLEMPTGEFLNPGTLADAVHDGTVKESTINEKVRRILRVMFTLGLFDENRSADSTLINTPEHQKVAYQAAVEGIVLLKNRDNILPLNPDKLKSIAVIGPNAAEARTQGGGSAMVTPVYSVSPLEALKNKLGDKIKINFAEGSELNGDVQPIDSSLLYLPDNTNVHGLHAEYFDNQSLNGTPKVTRNDEQIHFNWTGRSPAEGIPADHFSVRWTTKLKVQEDGYYQLQGMGDDGIRLYVDGKMVIDDWRDHPPIARSYSLELKKDKYYDLKFEYYQDEGGALAILGMKSSGRDPVKEAVEAAKKSDVAILFVGTSSQYESEGFDRDDMALPADQDELIKKVCGANKNTIVVVISGAPVLMNKWIGDVPAALEAWFGGDEAGNAIADVLLGNHNPSGKLPVTFPMQWKDCSAYDSYRKQDSVSVYSDGIFVGYRHFDKYNIKPLFPFGYGLSYTDFEYKNLEVEPMGGSGSGNYEVTFELANVGKREGVEIAQLYVHDPGTTTPVPVKELKRFARVSLKAGESTTVRFEVLRADFAHYDLTTDAWATRPGEYDIMIGSSSRDLKLKGTIQE